VVARRTWGRTIGLGSLMVVTAASLALSACSSGTRGEIPQASQFGASEVPCKETEGFTDLDGGMAPILTESVCWTRGPSGDIEGLVTSIRDTVAPDQETIALIDPTCSIWSGTESIEECVIGGVVSDDPYTFISVVARPRYSVEEQNLLGEGSEVEASIIEIHLQMVVLDDAIDQWERDKEGTHID